MSTLETDFMKSICVALCKRKDVRVWRQNSGKAIAVNPKTGKKYAIQMAPTGAADISGIFRDGRRIEIECKAAHEKPNQAQMHWRKFMHAFGAIYMLVVYDEEKTMDANVAAVVALFKRAINKRAPPSLWVI